MTSEGRGESFSIYCQQVFRPLLFLIFAKEKKADMFDVILFGNILEFCWRILHLDYTRIFFRDFRRIVPFSGECLLSFRHNATKRRFLVVETYFGIVVLLVHCG